MEIAVKFLSSATVILHFSKYTFSGSRSLLTALILYVILLTLLDMCIVKLVMSGKLKVSHLGHRTAHLYNRAMVMLSCYVAIGIWFYSVSVSLQPLLFLVGQNPFCMTHFSLLLQSCCKMVLKFMFHNMVVLILLPVCAL